MKAKPSAPEIILRNGKPAAVILGIEEYEEILERLEQMEDLRILREMRKRPIRFRSLSEFLKERPRGV